MKLKTGANKFRVLTPAVIGYQYWTEERKPVRAKELWKTIPADADISQGWSPKHFWAFVVWNYNENAVQILEITQATIQRMITDLVASDDWGDPKGYDLTINRKGEKLETEYNVQPSPHKEFTQPVSDVKAINLEALFEGEDPFGEKEPSAKGFRPKVVEEKFDTPFD